MKKTLIALILPLGVLFFSSSALASASAEELHFLSDPVQIANALSHSYIAMNGTLIREDVSQIDQHLKEKTKIIHYTQSYTLGDFDLNGFGQMTNQLTKVKKGSPYFLNANGKKVSEVYRESGVVSIFNDGSIQFAYSYGTQSCHLSIDKITLHCNGIAKFILLNRGYEVASKSVGQVSNVTKK